MFPLLLDLVLQMKQIIMEDRTFPANVQDPALCISLHKKHKRVLPILSTLALDALSLCGGTYFNVEGMRLSLGCSHPLLARGKLHLNLWSLESLRAAVGRCLSGNSEASEMF